MTLVYDIGKTNKKIFLFDEHYKVVEKIYARFEELTDLEGFPCDDLPAIVKWIKKTSKRFFEKYGKKIKAINFSCYGASLVHVDKKGEPLTPLINYLKPYPKEVQDSFYKKYGDESVIAQQTSSPQMGMLNSGLQLYWLKYAQPNIYNKIKWSLHFPQYLSYLFTGVPVSDYTSIGCHTVLWDYSRRDYHTWVYKEEIDKILPPIVTSDTSINMRLYGKKVKIGVGMHDSSSALLPYIRVNKKPFLLISTGTWSITLNPFNTNLLSQKELKNDCLNFMQSDGQSVRAARLFLGEEYKYQVKELSSFFNVKDDAHKKVQFKKELFKKCSARKYHCIAMRFLKTPWAKPEKSLVDECESFEEAYHQLMWELVTLQVNSSEMAVGKSTATKIYVDGGFAENEVYISILSNYYKDAKIRITRSPLGSSLGAAMVISDKKVKRKFIKRNYVRKKHR